MGFDDVDYNWNTLPGRWNQYGKNYKKESRYDINPDSEKTKQRRKLEYDRDLRNMTREVWDD